jgi:tetratricopeptide (TPR) repeat protein
MSKSKKEKLSQGKLEKFQKKLAKDLDQKKFESIDEINNYIGEKYIGKEIDFKESALSPQETAMDLIYEAWECNSQIKTIKLAEKALKIDKNCADAYNILAEVKAKTPMESLEYYAKGIEVGKISLGDSFNKFKGHFWGFHETRPFMRSLAGYSEVLWFLNERSKSIEVSQEMLQLNPNDNQGIRYQLIIRLLILNRLLDAEKLYNEYNDDYSTYWLYSRAYLNFSKRSKKPSADKALKEALEFNPYVPLYLFGLKDMPENLPQFVGIGDENEAISYVDTAMELWAKNKKAAIWLSDMYKRLKNDLDLLIDEREKKRNERFKI